MTTPTVPSSDVRKNEYVDLENARVDEQKQVMKEIINAAHCPFCWENLRQYHQEPILKEGKYWILTKNQWPYEHTKLHLMAIYKEHIENLTQLDPESGKELLEIMAWAQREYHIPGGGMAMRFGDTDYSAGTVAHLHAQLLWPDIMAADYDNAPVKVKIGKMWKDRKTD